MEEAVAARLLASIRAGRLVVLAGAGVSVSPPSQVPLARQLAEDCAQEHTRITSEILPPQIAGDLCEQAEFFRARGQLATHFVTSLIPWPKFRRPPNPGHYALADFLAAHVVDLVVTTNFDLLVERAAEDLGEPDFRSALDGVEANDGSLVHKPYLKLHGCCLKDRENTLWCQSQLATIPIADRIGTATTWLTGRLTGRDVLLLGFWSDWGYLNSVLEDAIRAATPASVIVVDIAGLNELRARAPGLWHWSHTPEVHFIHVPERAAEFLDELRGRFSRILLQQICEAARPEVEQLTGARCTTPIDFGTASTDQLYDIRRSFSGVPANAVTRVNAPDPQMEVVAATHFLLVSRGATTRGSVYTLGAATIRLVNGAGQLLSAVRRRFQEEGAAAVTVDMVICAGAHDDGGLPTSVVRGNSPGNIVRAGSGSGWMTLPQAREQLGI